MIHKSGSEVINKLFNWLQRYHLLPTGHSVLIKCGRLPHRYCWYWQSALDSSFSDSSGEEVKSLKGKQHLPSFVQEKLR